MAPSDSQCGKRPRSRIVTSPKRGWKRCFIIGILRVAHGVCRSAGVPPAGARASRSRGWRGQDAHAPAGGTTALRKRWRASRASMSTRRHCFQSQKDPPPGKSFAGPKSPTKAAGFFVSRHLRASPKPDRRICESPPRDVSEPSRRELFRNRSQQPLVRSPYGIPRRMPCTVPLWLLLRTNQGSAFPASNLRRKPICAGYFGSASPPGPEPNSRRYRGFFPAPERAELVGRKTRAQCHHGPDCVVATLSDRLQIKFEALIQEIPHGVKMYILDRAPSMRYQ